MERGRNFRRQVIHTSRIIPLSGGTLVISRPAQSIPRSILFNQRGGGPRQFNTAGKIYGFLIYRLLSNAGSGSEHRNGYINSSTYSLCGKRFERRSGHCLFHALRVTCFRQRLLAIYSLQSETRWRYLINNKVNPVAFLQPENIVRWEVSQKLSGIATCYNFYTLLYYVKTNYD